MYINHDFSLNPQRKRKKRQREKKEEKKFFEWVRRVCDKRRLLLCL